MISKEKFRYTKKNQMKSLELKNAIITKKGIKKQTQK